MDTRMFKLLSGILSKGSGRNDRSLVRGRSARHPFSLARLLGRYDAATTTIDNDYEVLGLQVTVATVL